MGQQFPSFGGILFSIIFFAKAFIKTHSLSLLQFF